MNNPLPIPCKPPAEERRLIGVELMSPEERTAAAIKAGRTRCRFFEPLVQDMLIEANGRMMSKKDQAGFIGVSARVLYGWLERGERDLTEYQEHEGPLTEFATFMMAYNKARAETAGRVTDTWIAQATDPERKDAWIAGATLLERAEPMEWSKRTNVTVQQDTKVTVEVIRTDDWQNVDASRGKYVEAVFVPEALPAAEEPLNG